jgi:Membrane proteins related to metalloendopeptidases
MALSILSATLAAFIPCRHVASQSLNNTDAITLTPALVESGAPELIRVAAARAQSVTGEWLGRKIVFFQAANHKAWYALAGVDVEAPSGPSVLKVDVTYAVNTTHLELPFEIHSAQYRSESITVAPNFVEPDAEQLKIVQADAALKARIFLVSASKPLWHGRFQAPVAARPTDSFGMRRIYNGTLASIHRGMDFRARRGTPVHASNSGVVVLARPLYYEGNCVVIDHGLGLYSISMHLSRITVREGQHVLTGQRVGISGATGRVTAAHLHWAIRLQDVYIDPAKLLKMNLAEAR